MQIKEELLDIEGIKNSNKPLLDLFIRRTAVLTQTSEFLTEKIIKDQWKNANKVIQPGSTISEIDFPNMGVLYMSPTKAKKRIERYERNNKYLDISTLSGDEKEETKNRLYKQRNLDMINHINVKLDNK